ncbi:MAG TPA: hypothetical protein PKD17_11045 [Cellvibrionaceae bacterium]|nr:hypothetical protein [Cellvibrionaceae bacterium]
MEIRLSRYNLPFVEYPIPGVYFIPKDFQRQMAMGLYDAHISLFRSLPKSNLFEVYNPLTDESHIFDLDNDHYLAPYARNPIASAPSLEDKKMLEDAYFNFGVKAAGRALGLCK